MRRLLLAPVIALALCLAALPAPAQMPLPAAAPAAKDAPAFYQADRAEYDREQGVVTLSGHVEMWQGGRLLLADQVTYNRNTGVARAKGHVVLMELGGQTVFAEEAELGAGMKDGVLTGIRALLAENGRLAANGARRTGGTVNELARAVYSTCDLCKDDPTRPPLWQIEARSAVQDTEHKMIEYRDAVVDFFGVPVLWLPYLTHPDPSQKRASGLLTPDFGYSKHLGAFIAQPYYWVIDGQSDATITPLIATSNGPALQGQYRRRFNDGTITIDASIANERASPGAHIFAKGQFAIDDVWRWGFDLQRTSSLNYMRDFRIAGRQSVLTSQAFIEGFGDGAWARLDARAYQALTSDVRSEKLPYVLPHAEYDFVSDPYWLGGRFSLNATAFNVTRNNGTNTQRAAASLGWQAGAIGRVGEVWDVQFHLDAASYVAHQFDQQPNYGAVGTTANSQAMPTLAVKVNWPLIATNSLGSQIVEPIAQLLVAPRGSTYLRTLIPNEDSLDQDFTDANLFALNRFPGVDRLEGGIRVNLGLHAMWTTPAGHQLDALIGQGYRAAPDRAFLAGSGLEKTASDIVGHLSYTPSAWLDLTTRERLDNRSLRIRFAEGMATFGPSWLKFNAGYTYSLTNPFYFYDTPGGSALATTPRHEGVLGVTAREGSWRFHADGRRDLALGKMVSLGFGAGYEDECFIFDVSYQRRYTSINGDNGATTILFEITLKTVGQFGFHAL
jgi:LPS-assembly protein